MEQKQFYDGDFKDAALNKATAFIMRKISSQEAIRLSDYYNEQHAEFGWLYDVIEIPKSACDEELLVALIDHAVFYLEEEGRVMTKVLPKILRDGEFDYEIKRKEN